MFLLYDKPSIYDIWILILNVNYVFLQGIYQMFGTLVDIIIYRKWLHLNNNVAQPLCYLF